MSVCKAMALTAVMFASILVTIGPASAGAALWATPDLPGPVIVGQIGVPGSVQVAHSSTGLEGTAPLTITRLRLALSCGSASFGGSALCSMPDSGVFSITSPATGEGGTGCAGTTFSASEPDASGVVTLTPSAPVILGPPGSGTDICRVIFTYDVVRLPSFDSQPGIPGAQTSTLFEGTGDVSGHAAFGVGTSSITVEPIPPKANIETQTSSILSLGAATTATATLTASEQDPTPTGIVRFFVFGPVDPTCAGTPVFTSTNPVSPVAAGMATATSDPFVPTQAGVYHFVASYDGDATYSPAVSPCGDPEATVLVTVILPAEPPVADFDGDDITDVSVFRPGNNTWYLRTPSPTAIVWGAAGDIPVPGDYDGNGTTDMAVFRPSNNTWYLRTGVPFAAVWGAAGDIPVPGDYDGNGTTDIAVFRPSNGGWYLRTAAPSAIVWGQSGDIPVPGDYDNNGTTDLAVFRPSNNTWYLRTTSPTAVVWGAAGDIPVPGDYDGNGTTDVAVFRPSTGTWYLRTAAPTASVWGQNGDVPVPGDYDGGGTVDLAVFRPSSNTWYVRTAPPFAVVWGTAGDIPLPVPQAVYRTYFP